MSEKVSNEAENPALNKGAVMRIIFWVFSHFIDGVPVFERSTPYEYRAKDGKWCVEIGKKRELIWREGYHGTSLRNIKTAKQWAKFHIVPSCTEQWID